MTGVRQARDFVRSFQCWFQEKQICDFLEVGLKFLKLLRNQIFNYPKFLIKYNWHILLKNRETVDDYLENLYFDYVQTRVTNQI
jgi:hypothetical protein